MNTPDYEFHLDALPTDAPSAALPLSQTTRRTSRWPVEHEAEFNSGQHALGVLDDMLVERRIAWVNTLYGVFSPHDPTIYWDLSVTIEWPTLRLLRRFKLPRLATTGPEGESGDLWRDLEGKPVLTAPADDPTAVYFSSIAESGQHYWCDLDSVTDQLSLYCGMSYQCQNEDFFEIDIVHANLHPSTITGALTTKLKQLNKGFDRLAA